MRFVLASLAFGTAVVTMGCSSDTATRYVARDELEGRTDTRPLNFHYTEQLTVCPNRPGVAVLLDGAAVGVTPITVDVDYGRLAGRHVVVRKVVVRKRIEQRVRKDGSAGAIHEDEVLSERVISKEVVGAADDLGYQSKVYLAPVTPRVLRLVETGGSQHAIELSPHGEDPVLLGALDRAGFYEAVRPPRSALGERTATWPVQALSRVRTR